MQGRRHAQDDDARYRTPVSPGNSAMDGVQRVLWPAMHNLFGVPPPATKGSQEMSREPSPSPSLERHRQTHSLHPPGWRIQGMQKSKVRGGGAVGSEFAPPSLHPLGWAGSGRASSGASSSSQEEWEHFAWFQERLFAFELEDWEGSDFEGPLGPSPPLCGGPTPPAQEGVIVPELWTKTGKKEERQAEDFGGEKDNDTSILSQASTEFTPRGHHSPLLSTPRPANSSLLSTPRGNSSSGLSTPRGTTSSGVSTPRGDQSNPYPPSPRMSSPRKDQQLSSWNNAPHPPPRSPIKDDRMHSKSNSSNSARAGDTVLPSPVDLLRGKTYHSEQEVEVEVEYDVMWTKVESLENVLRRERLSELERERERETERSMELAIIDSLNAKCKALEEEEARMEEDRNKFLQQLQAVSDWLPPLSPRGCVLQTEGERGRGREREEVGPASRVEVKQTEEELQWRALEKETEEALEDLRADFEREQQEQKNRQREKHKKSAWERLGEKVPWGVENPPLEEREWSEERELVKETDELRARFEREKERGRGWEREEKSAFRGRGRGRMLSLTRQLPPPNSEQVFSLLTPAYIRGSYS